MKIKTKPQRFHREYKIWWDEKEEIARIFVSGAVDEEITVRMVEEGDKITEKYGKKINWLVDLAKVTKTVPSSQMRKMMAKRIKLMAQGKLAIIGASIIVRTVMNFICAVAGKKNVKFFPTEEEALKWLKEK